MKPSMRTLTESEALAWVANVFSVPVGSVTRDTPRSDIVLWDSLGVLMVMASLDEDFGITATDAEMRACQKVGDLLALLQKHGRLAA